MKRHRQCINEKTRKIESKLDMKNHERIVWANGEYGRTLIYSCEYNYQYEGREGVMKNMKICEQ